MMDIFNSGTYELIPYVVYNDFNVGYPNVLNRFLLLDIWLLRILNHLKLIQDNTLKYAFQKMYTNLAQIRKIGSLPDKTIYDAPASYLGQYINLQRMTSKLAMKNKFYPYNPEQYRYQRGTYRVIK
jgi:hypothetical protein